MKIAFWVLFIIALILLILPIVGPAVPGQVFGFLILGMLALLGFKVYPSN